MKAADAIASISLASKVSNASIDFVTDVMTNSLKEIKINGEDYTAATAGITVTSDGTASKLKDGSVILEETKDVVIDVNTVTAATGNITVSAAESKFASVSAVDAGDVFKVNSGTEITYTTLRTHWLWIIGALFGSGSYINNRRPVDQTRRQFSEAMQMYREDVNKSINYGFARN